MIRGKIRKERDALLKEIKASPPGAEALKKLAYYREEYDCSNPDYLNTLKILSDTTYEDRKHFLLELIQNADDATYEETDASIRFIIKENSLELRYNEDGFDTDDVIAITGAGASTKTGKRKLSHSFIGEKGIGFKSVFALASEVEIESPPWNFALRREKCVVPQIRTSKKLKESHGTRIGVHFDKPGIINDIAKELFRFVDGQIESFLFLQTLSAFSVEDHREKPIQKRRVVITPPDRSGKFLQLRTDPGNQQRTYFYYSEEVVFPAELVTERWEKIGPDLGALPRKIIVAIPKTDNDTPPKNGALFCFLPTKVTLPVPLFLHVDGVTTADRERLQNPENNHWNHYLFKYLPEILLNSILEMRKYPDMAESIQNYIPVTPGTEQLQNVFVTLILRLRITPWIRIFTAGETEWATPEEVVQIDDFWTPWFEKYPELMRSAEKIMAKKFVYPGWTTSKTWNSLKDFYRVPLITPKQVAQILAGCQLPQEFMQDESNLIELYRYISNLIEKITPNYFMEIKNILLTSQIYPLEGGEFGALHSENHAEKIYWLSDQTPKKTGLDRVVEFRIVNPEYTYKPKMGQELPDKRKNKLIHIDDRNRTVRILLVRLGIEELDDKHILSDLQIPWLLNPKRIDDEDCSTLYHVLSILFDSYQAKRTTRDDPGYLSQLYKISDVVFPSSTGHLQQLKNLLLPIKLRLEPTDHIYSESGLETLNFPKKMLEITENDSGVNVDDRESGKKTKKLLEDWRLFLINCGIKIKPKFTFYKYEHPSVFDFRQQDNERFQIWKNKIQNDSTWHKFVDKTYIELDFPTEKIIENQLENTIPLSELLFITWKERFGKILQKPNKTNMDIIPGEFHAKYYWYQDREKILQDYLWAGIERHKIPLTTINNKSTNLHRARCIPLSARENLPTTAQFIDLVTSSNDLDHPYYAKYLESLNVKTLSIADINELWKKVDPGKYGEIINVALECVKAKLIFGRLLELFDKEEKRIRPVTDFYLGKQAPKGIPLIEEQYGDSGRDLGKLLDLPVEDDAHAFIGVFDKIFEKKLGVQTINRSEKFYGLMKNWSKWDKTSKQLIKDDLKDSLKKHNLASEPFIIFNDPAIANSLQKINAIVIQVEVNADEIPKFKNVAKDLKLIFPEECGELKIENEVGLNEQEIQEFKKICDALLYYYDEEDKGDLSELLERIGSYKNFENKIRKTSSIKRVITLNGEFVIPVKTPIFREPEQLLYVSEGLKIKEIISEYFARSGFGRKKQNLRDIKEALSLIILKKPTRDPAIQDGNKRPLPEYGVTSQEAGEKLKGSLASTPVGPGLKENDGQWKVGLFPEEEKELRKQLGDTVINSLKDGPEIHRKKLQTKVSRSKPFNLQDNEKLIDPDIPDPKTYLKGEYNGGQCQICGIVLPLINGNNFFEIFRIIERNSEIWYNNRAFNILCLCPNHHALAKHGGRDFSNIYTFAGQVRKGEEFPREVDEFNGDFYVIPVILNGSKEELKMSKPHMSEFCSVTSKNDENQG